MKTGNLGMLHGGATATSIKDVAVTLFKQSFVYNEIIDNKKMRDQFKKMNFFTRNCNWDFKKSSKNLKE